MKPQFQASNRQEWRSWLEKNHDRAREVWLIFYKKHTGRPCVTYMESLEEALCFGWIDGKKMRVDDETYTHRFTPRLSGSKWSSHNIEIARRMIAGGRMSPAGLEAFRRRKTYSDEVPEVRSTTEVSLLPDIEKELRRSKKAWANFQKLSPGYRKQYVIWLSGAKREDTRERRLKEAIALLNKNEKPGMR